MLHFYYVNEYCTLLSAKNWQQILAYKNINSKLNLRLNDFLLAIWKQMARTYWQLVQWYVQEYFESNMIIKNNYSANNKNDDMGLLNPNRFEMKE